MPEEKTIDSAALCEELAARAGKGKAIADWKAMDKPKCKCKCRLVPQ